MNEGLYVNYEELDRTREEVIELLNKFNQYNVQFGSKLSELKTYWDGVDYEMMATNVKNVMGKITGAEGAVPKLMTDIANELQQKSESYRSVQNSNVGYWG